MSELSSGDIAMLRMARGGISLKAGTAAERQAERLSELGYMKEVTPLASGWAWKLTGRGCEVAYRD